MLSAQMCVYTTKGLCLLTDGDYELVLKPTPLDDTCPEESGSSWENVDLEMEDVSASSTPKKIFFKAFDSTSVESR